MERLMFTGGEILTMDERYPIAERIVIEDNIIVHVGDKDSTKSFIDSTQQKYQTIELDGQTVIPGFIESHVHPTFYGMTQFQVNCRPDNTGSIREIISKLKSGINGIKNGWLIGAGYDDTLLKELRHPTRYELDDVSTSIPVVVIHISGHFAVGNSVALNRAGISRDSLDPVDGKIIRDNMGEPTGLLWEIGAVRLLNSVIPKPDQKDLIKYTKIALSVALSKGITTIHDMAVGLTGGSDAGLSVVEAYQKLVENKDLSVRVRGFLRGDEEIMAKIDKTWWGDPSNYTGNQEMFRMCGVKYWADGSIQGLSAALSSPYQCCADDMVIGDLNYSQSTLNRMVSDVIDFGWQVAVHANGDRAIESALRAFENAIDQYNGTTKSRYRLEHVQVVSQRQLEVIKSLGVVCSFFINHIYYWGDRHRDRFLGAARSKVMDPVGSAAEMGIRFGMHSDCPVTMMDPLFSIWVAVNRLTSSGLNLGEEERLGIWRALKAFGSDAACLVGDEGRYGVLREGYVADLCLLSENPLKVAPMKLKDISVSSVMVDGKWKYGDMLNN